MEQKNAKRTAKTSQKNAVAKSAKTQAVATQKSANVKKSTATAKSAGATSAKTTAAPKTAKVQAAAAQKNAKVQIAAKSISVENRNGLKIVVRTAKHPKYGDDVKKIENARTQGEQDFSAENNRNRFKRTHQALLIKMKMDKNGGGEKRRSLGAERKAPRPRVKPKKHSTPIEDEQPKRRFSTGHITRTTTKRTKPVEVVAPEEVEESAATQEEEVVTKANNKANSKAKSTKNTNKAANKAGKSTGKTSKGAKSRKKKGENLPAVATTLALTIRQKKPPTELDIEGWHNLLLHAYLFDDVSKPKAIVVIVHGMMEHATRYADFADFLNRNGFLVLATDQRGHGKTMKDKTEYGCGEKDIFAESVRDQNLVIEYAHKTFGLPVFVFGHSYGSMITQFLIQQNKLIKKAVLCGTANGSSLALEFGYYACKMLAPFTNKNKRKSFAEKFVMNRYEKDFDRGNWLTRDEAEFDKYLADEFCGGNFPFAFYRSLLKNMHHANNGINRIGKKKLFLIAGEADPVGSQGKQVRSLYKRYLQNNINAKLKIYPQARHELINETNKEEVYADVLDFYNYQH